MHNILCLNKISPLGTDRLGENYTYAAEIENPEGILVRSAAMHDMELRNREGRRGREQHSRGKVRGSRHCGVQHTRRKRQRREGAGAGGTAFDVEKNCPGD